MRICTLHPNTEVRKLEASCTDATFVFISANALLPQGSRVLSKSSTDVQRAAIAGNLSLSISAYVDYCGDFGCSLVLLMN